MVKDIRKIGVVVTDTHDKMPYQIQGKDGELLLFGMFFRELDVVEFKRPAPCTWKRSSGKIKANEASNQKMMALMPPEEEDTILATWKPPALLASISKQYDKNKAMKLKAAAWTWKGGPVARAAAASLIWAWFS